MKNKLCIKCKENPIQIKKRDLCFRCYQRLRRKEGNLINKTTHSFLTKKTEIKYAVAAEIEFIKNFFSHQNWIYHPGIFRLNDSKYAPDFYDGERNIFIEVSGTRQAYHFNKLKYEKFRELFPKINFEIRKPSGELLNEDTHWKDW